MLRFDIGDLGEIDLLRLCQLNSHMARLHRSESNNLPVDAVMLWWTVQMKAECCVVLEDVPERKTPLLYLALSLLSSLTTVLTISIFAC